MIELNKADINASLGLKNEHKEYDWFLSNSIHNAKTNANYGDLEHINSWSITTIINENLIHVTHYIELTWVGLPRTCKLAYTPQHTHDLDPPAPKKKGKKNEGNLIGHKNKF